MKSMLTIANAHYEGGLSGSDNIYINLNRYFPVQKQAIWEMVAFTMSPFVLNYVIRIFRGIWQALWTKERYDVVYSASDFLMDCIPALIMKIKGSYWVAGFYLYAPPSNVPYWLSQRISYFLIKNFADTVCITNDSMKWGFLKKHTISVNGGVNFEDILWSMKDGKKEYKYDAVFCGRIHKTKGIDELIEVWRKVRHMNPYARLAIIGDGDLGLGYIRKQIGNDDLGIDLLGFMGNERFAVYAQSRCFLYTSTYDHFSMAPVEAMACGCPVFMFDLPCMTWIQNTQGIYICSTVSEMARRINAFIQSPKVNQEIIQVMAKQYAYTWDWQVNANRIYHLIKRGLNESSCDRG